MANRGKLFVVSGPAGAGKSEIVKTLLKKHDDVKLSVSCTTRAPRPGEVNGVSYHFVTEERFRGAGGSGRVLRVGSRPPEPLRHAEVRCGRSSWTQGHDLILEIDVQGCLQAMKQNPDATGVFICPPSRENLEKRLRNRGTETEESIRVRLGNVAGEVRSGLQIRLRDHPSGLGRRAQRAGRGGGRALRHHHRAPAGEGQTASGVPRCSCPHP